MQEYVANIRTRKPLIHCITNFVTMDFIANGLLSLGASPVMSHSEKELEEMVAFSSALLINIGTLDEYWYNSFRDSILFAKKYRKKVVFDPVGAGATRYRTELSLDLLQYDGIKVIKGNASEIAVLSGVPSYTRGVDSVIDLSQDIIEAAKLLSDRYNVIVVVTGKQDLVLYKDSYEILNTGHEMMSKVTGSGCLLGGIIAAFIAANDDDYMSVCKAVKFYGDIGKEVALSPSSNGPGSFKVGLIDAIGNSYGD